MHVASGPHGDTIHERTLGPATVRKTPQEDVMTSTHEPDVITEALAIIDRALSEMVNRELVSTGEMSDLLLDVRSLLSHPTAQ